MKVSAQLNNLRVSPRKTRLVANFIRGLDADAALVQLENNGKDVSVPMKKLVESAIANGENNFGIDRNNMVIEDVMVGAGTTLKRWRPRAYGRAGAILKRTSQVKLVIAEKVEGKNRKSREEMEKERKKRAEEKKKQEKEMLKEQAQKEKETKAHAGTVPEKSEPARDVKPSGKDTAKSNWTSKIFRRKSM
jgi:large subunit ribosomal protein L22